MNAKIIAVAAAAAVAIFFSSAYIVDETEQAVVTQFGKIVSVPKTDPGLYFRIPVIQNLNYFPKHQLYWDGDPGQIPTLGKTYIWVDTFARWKIFDVVKFFQTTGDLFTAKSRLDDIIDPAVRNFVTSHRLIETVRWTNRELDSLEMGGEIERETKRTQQIASRVTIGREGMEKKVQEQAQPKLNQFGIELVSVKIKRINYIEQVQESVYGRMIAERKQVAENLRSEGRGEAQKIIGEKEKDLKEITSEAYRQAQEIKGKADATITRIYAEAFGVDPEFYAFSKALEIYPEILDQESSLVFSTDAEFLKYFKGRDSGTESKRKE